MALSAVEHILADFLPPGRCVSGSTFSIRRRRKCSRNSFAVRGAAGSTVLGRDRGEPLPRTGRTESPNRESDPSRLPLRRGILEEMVSSRHCHLILLGLVQGGTRGGCSHRQIFVSSRLMSGARHNLIKVCHARGNAILKSVRSSRFHGARTAPAGLVWSRASVTTDRYPARRRCTRSSVAQKTPLKQECIVDTRCDHQQFFIGMIVLERVIACEIRASRLMRPACSPTVKNPLSRRRDGRFVRARPRP